MEAGPEGEAQPVEGGAEQMAEMWPGVDAGAEVEVGAEADAEARDARDAELARERACSALNAQRGLLGQKRHQERELVASIREARLAYEPLPDEDDRWHEVGQLRRDQAALRESIGVLRCAVGRRVGSNVRRGGSVMVRALSDEDP